jgi:hypothetical protein
MYPSGNRPSLWTEFWVLTRAVYGIILWPVLALVALLLGLLAVLPSLPLALAAGAGPLRRRCRLRLVDGAIAAALRSLARRSLAH